MENRNRIWQQGGVKGDGLGHMVPISKGGNDAKELLTVSKERDAQSALANSQAHTRYEKVEGALACMLNTIAGDDEGHKFAMQHHNAGSVSELGLGRAEFMQKGTNLLVPSTLPVAPSYSASRAIRDNQRRWPLSSKRSRREGEPTWDE